jgi:nicotinamide riboside kinase
MIKIIITGPESTGKSTLAKNLSNYLGEPFVPEYARYFLPVLKEPYTASHLLEIAHGQNFWHRLYKSNNKKLLICDTGVEAIDIWFQYRFGGIDAKIRELLTIDEECIYLLCKPDIPWAEDTLRETPHQRPQIFSSFESLLYQLGKKYFIVEGQNEEDRLRCALDYLNKILS